MTHSGYNGYSVYSFIGRLFENAFTVIMTIIIVMAERTTTTIQISIRNRDRLDQVIAHKRETYDEIIGRILDFYEVKHAGKLENEFTKGYNAVKRKMK